MVQALLFEGGYYFVQRMHWCGYYSRAAHILLSTCAGVATIRGRPLFCSARALVQLYSRVATIQGNTNNIYRDVRAK